MLSGLVCPGVGQIYNGQWAKGVATLTGVLAGLGYLFYGIWKGFSAYFAMMNAITDPTFVTTPPTPGLSGWLFRGVLIGGGPAITLWVWSAWDAHRVALRRGGGGAATRPSGSTLPLR